MIYNDYTNKGKCSGCGRCCSNYLPLTTKEISYLRAYVKLNKIKPSYHLVDSFTICPFLDNSNKCTIYENRPSICKNYKCDYFKTKDFKNMNIDNYRLVDLRKEIFKEK